jgi:ATP-dependent helicase HrpA
VHHSLQQRRAVHNKIIEWKKRARANRSFQETRYQEYLNCLGHILPEQFLHSLQPAQLKHKPRYLQALALRVERAEHAPLKDDKKAERLIKPLARLQQMAQFTNPTLPCQTASRSISSCSKNSGSRFLPLSWARHSRSRNSG